MGADSGPYGQAGGNVFIFWFYDFLMFLFKVSLDLEESGCGDCIIWSGREMVKEKSLPPSVGGTEEGSQMPAVCLGSRIPSFRQENHLPSGNRCCMSVWRRRNEQTENASQGRQNGRWTGES